MAGTVLFIDGAYLYRALEDLGREFFGEPVELDYETIFKMWPGTSRVNYYDCGEDEPPEKGLEFEERKRKKDAHLKLIGRQNGFRMRCGTLRTREAGSKAKREQKEVDVLIAVDMIRATYRHEMELAVLWSGDLDLRPAVEEISREGVRVIVVANPRNWAEGLIEAADDYRRLTPSFLMGIATQGFKTRHESLEVVGIANPENQAFQWQPLQAGKMADRTARLYRDRTGEKLGLWVEGQDGSGTMYCHRDRALLERWVEMEIGKVEWLS